MTNWLLAVCVATGASGGPDWTPPADPDPHRILEEAREDARAGRHEAALAKHEWFHREALELRPSLYGVRLSFALADWMKLGQAHPPALASLKRFRDQALAQVLGGQGGHAEFHDFVSINEVLDDSERTRAAFLRLDQEKPDAVKALYGLAEPALVEAKEYAVCGRYLQPDEDWARLAFTRATEAKLGLDDSLGPAHAGFREQWFRHHVALLIALLALNERASDADRIAQKARAEWDDAAFHQAIDDALKGQVPPTLP